MTKEEIRNRVVEMASGSKGIIVSIPEALAMVGGEMYAYRLLDVAKVRVPQNENPMRCTSVLGGKIMLLPMQTLRDCSPTPPTWRSFSRCPHIFALLGIFIYFTNSFLN